MTGSTQARVAEALRLASMTPGQLAVALSYSVDTVQRDLDQLAAAGLVEALGNGRRRLTALGELRVARWIAEGIASERADLVAAARVDGASWAEVGEALGVTRQAAHKAYGREVSA